jgi:hypothetical protein
MPRHRMKKGPPNTSEGPSAASPEPALRADAASRTGRRARGRRGGRGVAHGRTVTRGRGAGNRLSWVVALQATSCAAGCVALRRAPWAMPAHFLAETQGFTERGSWGLEYRTATTRPPFLLFKRRRDIRVPPGVLRYSSNEQRLSVQHCDSAIKKRLPSADARGKTPRTPGRADATTSRQRASTCRPCRRRRPALPAPCRLPCARRPRTRSSGAARRWTRRSAARCG